MAKPVPLRRSQRGASVASRDLTLPEWHARTPQSTRTRIDPALSDILSTAAMSASRVRRDKPPNPSQVTAFCRT